MNDRWQLQKDIKQFPYINTKYKTSFNYTWYRCESLEEFPRLNVCNGTNFEYAWYKCKNLEYFPPNMFDNLSNKLHVNCFIGTWADCGLNLKSIENILTSINKLEIYYTPYLRPITLDTKMTHIPLPNNILDLIQSLTNKGWVITINGETF